MSQHLSGLFPPHITHTQPSPTPAFNRAVFGITDAPASYFGGSGTADARKIGGPK